MHNKVDYVLSQDGKSAEVKELVTLYNADEAEKTTQLQFVFGNQVFAKEVCLQGGETQRVEFVFDLQNVRLWDINNPYLYTIYINTDTDDLFDRTGFRKLEVKPDGVYLNDRRVEIRGVNRHEEHPEWGFAFPLKLMKKDLDIAFQMGCNAIRGSHYPNSRAFMDYCDETGMLFWSEIPIWGCGFSPETLGREKVLARGLEMHREMLHYYKHTGDEKYKQIFDKVCDYAFTHFSDREYGEWFGYLRRDGKPTQPPCKGHTYKGPFHVMRMLAKCIVLLKNEA